MINFDKRDYARQCPKIKTLIHWYSLPENKVIKLNKKFQKIILNKICSNLKYGQKRELARKLKLSRSYIKYLLDLKSNFSVGSLKRISKEAKISFNEVEKHIIGFGRKRMIKNPKFPFNMNSDDGIALRSIINSEGHISKQIGRSVMIRVPEKDMLRKAITISKNLFGEFNVKIKKTKDKDTSEIYLPGEIGDILVISGLTRGRKIIKNPYVPRDIILGSLNKKKIYLQWSIAGEMECTRNSKVLKLTRNVDVSDVVNPNFIRNLKDGVIYKKDIPKYIINQLNKKQQNLLVGESLMLKDFDIIREPYVADLWKRKDGGLSAAWTLPITNKKEISILYNKIGIPLKEKSNKVKKLLSSYAY